MLTALGQSRQPVSSDASFVLCVLGDSVVSPTSPTIDVSAYAATDGLSVFPLQIVLCYAAGQFPAEAFEEDFLVVVGLRHAPGADAVALLGREDDIDGAQLAQLFQDPSRFVSVGSPGTELEFAL